MTINGEVRQTQPLDSHQMDDVTAARVHRAQRESVRKTSASASQPEVNATDEITWDEV